MTAGAQPGHSWQPQTRLCDRFSLHSRSNKAACETQRLICTLCSVFSFPHGKRWSLEWTFSCKVNDSDGCRDVVAEVGGAGKKSNDRSNSAALLVLLHGKLHPNHWIACTIHATILDEKKETD